MVKHQHYWCILPVVLAFITNTIGVLYLYYWCLTPIVLALNTSIVMYKHLFLVINAYMG